MNAPETDVHGFEGLYVVSTQGEIKSLDRVVFGKKKQTVGERVIKQFDNGSGYKTVRLWRDGKQTMKYVHRVVLEAFVGLGGDMDACHNDGDKTNNTLANLRWDTRSSNHIDKLTHGTMANGEKARSARLTEKEVKEIRARLSFGEEQSSLAIYYGVKQPTISDIKSRRTWHHI